MSGLLYCKYETKINQMVYYNCMNNSTLPLLSEAPALSKVLLK